MIRKLSAVAIVVALTLVAFAFLPAPTRAQDEAPFGPWVDGVVWSQNSDTSIVLTQIIEGDEDYLGFTVIGATNKLRAAGAPEIWTVRTFGSYSGFVMNPIPQVTGFNPFTIDEVREGVQWLVDRDLIAREVYSGFATPFLGPYHPVSADYGRYIDEIILLEDKYANDPARAREQITNALTDAGASLDANGKWRDPDGDLIELTVWMRIEDERLIEGQYISDLLGGMGFTMSPTPIDRTFISEVYGGPSDQGRWHIYTEGFISTAQALYDDWQMHDFYGCYWEDWCLESEVYDDGYKPPQAQFDTYEALAFGEYTSLDERNQMIKGALPDVHPNAYRAWTVAEESVYPVNNRVSAAYDLFGGPIHELWSRTAKLSDAPNDDGSGGTLRAVNLLAGQDAWNPYIVIGTLYDSDIRDMINDFGMLRHPHTGRWIDARADTSVATAGPDDVLDVPSTAEMFNTTSNTWEPVGAGVNATSAVTVNLNLGKWHHNVTMNEVDVRHEIAMDWRRAFGDLSIQPNAISSSAKAFLSKYKGFEFIDDDTYVTYIDFWHIDEPEIAANGVYWPDLPWELHETLAQSMLDGNLAADEKDATALGVPWMDQTKGASLAIIEEKMDNLTALDHEPLGEEGMVSVTDAQARWAALQQWYSDTGHFFLSSGPFWLESFDTASWSFTLKAHRDGYPFRADYWEEYRFPKIPDVALKAPSTVFSGVPAVFAFTSVVAGSPYDDITSIWFLKDLTTGEIIEQGAGTQIGAGAYTVTLSADLTEELLFGNFELILVVSSADAAPPTIRRAAFLVLPSTAWFEGLVTATESALEGDITALETQQADLTQSINDATAATQGLVLLVTTLAILAVISIVVAVVSVVLVLRRGKPPT